ncbi:hypothetical protein ACFQZ4_00765 [Catellatospora coxensis]
MYGLIALAVVLIAWAAVSARAARYSVTLPIALLLAGCWWPAATIRWSRWTCPRRPCSTCYS